MTAVCDASDLIAAITSLATPCWMFPVRFLGAQISFISQRVVKIAKATTLRATMVFFQDLKEFVHFLC